MEMVDEYFLSRLINITEFARKLLCVASFLFIFLIRFFYFPIEFRLEELLRRFLLKKGKKKWIMWQISGVLLLIAHLSLIYK